MPRYYSKKPTQIEKKYEIKNEYNKYLLVTRISPFSTMLYIGGIDNWCLEIQISPDNLIAQMPKIEYDEKCSLTGRFNRGVDTLQILSLMISYITNEFPHIRHIAFEDFSYRKCNDRQHIDLAYFYYALYGQTWYMKKMGARFERAEDLEKFTNASRIFNEMKKTMKWEDYDDCVSTEHPLPTDTIIKIYNAADTWHSFFRELSNQVDIAELCEYMSPWITTFIKKYTDLHFTAMKFIIDVPNMYLPKMNYNLIAYIKNGGKYTRKRQKKRKVDLR